MGLTILIGLAVVIVLCQLLIHPSPELGYFPILVRLNPPSGTQIQASHRDPDRDAVRAKCTRTFSFVQLRVSHPAMSHRLIVPHRQPALVNVSGCTGELILKTSKQMDPRQLCLRLPNRFSGSDFRVLLLQLPVCWIRQSIVGASAY